ncbi:MAG: PAS domain S-box protein [Verrucomicrobiae bacterium]|nr:PAS domain S-box protein [Verrucomicrobiae bacterium]
MKSPVPSAPGPRPTVVESARSKTDLAWKTAFLEAQVNSSLDGILVVDQQGKKILQNQRFTNLLKIPRHLADDEDDRKQLVWVTDTIKNPAQFLEKVAYLNSHTAEISRDEIELKDGTMLDRYSAPVVGPGGEYYGRIWTFRDVTKQRRVARELKQAKVAAALREGVARYTFLADAIPLIIWTARPDGRVDYYNKAWFDYTGLTLAQTQDWGWGAVLHPEDLPACIAGWTRSLTTGEDYEMEYRFKRAVDGAYRWFLGRASARRNPAGEIEQWVGTCTDIEDQKRAHAELEGKVAGRTAELAASNQALRVENAERKQAEESLRLLGSAVEQTRESIMITDAELDLPGPKIIFVNPAFTKMTGYNEADVLGKTPRILQGPHTDRTVLDRLRKNLEQGRVFEGEAINYRKDGTEFNLEWQIAPLRNVSGKITHFVAIQHDITGRKQAENALRDSHEKFHQLADNITDVFWIRSPDLSEVQYLSPAFEQIWGRSIKTLQANPHLWADFILPEDRERVVAAFTALTGDQRNLDIQYRIVRPDGEVRWVHVRGFQVRDAAGKLIRHTGIVTDITEPKRLENLMLQSEARYRSLIDNARDAIFTLAIDGSFTSLNPAVETITRSSRAEWVGKPFTPMLHPDDVPLARALFHRVLTGELVPVHELRGHPGLARPALMEITLTAQKDERGKIIGVLGIGRDMTDRKRLEARLIQSQKMETVGKLAGGIAHEFNSILTAIIGQGELLLGDLPAGSPLNENVTEILKAANRAATLTRQLLAYGRKQILSPEILDLNSVLAGLEGALRHLAGRHADLRLIPAPGLAAVKADAGQMEQVLMNLVINACDAMPNGGKLLLETANVSFDADSVGRYPELKPGGYVMLAVTDTGTGMSAEVKARAFEPFFSTKGVGQGTGLGLSTCYGIIKQSGGHIGVYSEPGRGTTFKIYLPQFAAPVQLPVPRLASPDLPHGTETILLVEDDPALREMAATLLQRLGYTVLTAADGIEALSLKQRREVGHIDLLFTDVVMPHMSGKELADRVQVLYPHTKILFTSAYTENAIAHQGGLNPGVALLQKPFTPSALANKLREVLDHPAAPKPAKA